MRTNHLPGTPVTRTIAIALGVLAWLAPGAAAQSVNLVAAPTTTLVTLPNGTSLGVPMWGFGIDTGVSCTDTTGALAAAVSVPGPRITVPAGATTLTINLRNCLPVATSVVIPGQPFEALPGTNPDGRIRSMTPETSPDSTRPYTFSGLRPGTFLYHSGSHMAVQVQMGLYGAMTMNFKEAGSTAAEAYEFVAYDHEVVLLYSEIDVALHQAVADGTYGTAPGPTSTIDYAPSLYLINGKSYANDSATPPIAAGTAEKKTLLRLLNAGLKSHAPIVNNGAMSVAAEDGNRYPFPRPQAALLLAAGKTHDAIWVPPAAGTYSVYDRLLGLNALGQGAAGMLVKLQVAAVVTPPDGTPTAVADAYATAEDTALVVSAEAGVLDNDTDATGAVLVTSPHGGTLSFSGDGSFTYTPIDDFFGVDGFTYRASNATGESTAAMVLITIGGVPDAPVATSQSVDVAAGESVPILLAGADPDRDPLTFHVASLPATGTLSFVDPVTHVPTALVATDVYGGTTQRAIPSGTLLYAAGAAGSPSFTFVVVDPSNRVSAPATVSITVHPAETTADCGTCTPVTITVTRADTGGAISSFRWTVEEDRTFDVTPGDLSVTKTLAVNFHRSYMPVVQSGVAPGEMPTLDFGSGQRYFVSVLPTQSGLANGGAAIATGQTSANVTVDAGPIPTAQIRVRLFNDNAPLNNAWDNVEAGLEGFAVTLEDAGGRYGMSAGQQLMDAFGNPIGTRYAPCASPPCDSYQVLQYGKGFLETDVDGYALFENLVPGKYGVKVIPPGGEAWQQTTTIEGTKAIDAWVKANEPSYFTEFGPPGPHAIIGFTQAVDLLEGPGVTVSGQVVNLHLSRPPDPSMYGGAPFDFTTPWVALNEGVGAAGTLKYVQPTDDEGHFSIASVPPGSYTLVIFDSALNIIIASRVLNICASGSTPPCTNPALGPVPVNHWFTRLYNYVFEDSGEAGQAENGFRDPGEPGIPEQAINIRWRDGSMYQSSATDGSGFVPFEEVFPFFSWLVAEVDFTRHKATGVTVVVDNGGNPTNTGWPAAVGAELDPAVLVPQAQPDNANAAFRTETGPVLLQAFQGFLGQSSVLLWGKTPYAPEGSSETDVNAWPFDVFPGEGDTDANGNGAFDGDQFHGGVSGIVQYSITRAENDPRWGFAEPWEPGIPRVRVQLWDLTRTKLLNEVTTDSWDDSEPTGCPGPVFTYQNTDRDCYDGMRNWNQVRPGVFDGGYAFLSQLEPIAVSETTNWLTPVGARDNAGFREVPLPAGRYIVKVIAPTGYEVVGEEDKNVDFGLEFIPQQFMLSGYTLGDAGPSDPASAPRVENTPLAAPFCVGAARLVPAELTLFPGVPGTYAGQVRPACDEKLVTLRNGQNPGANFFLFTEAPVAGHIVGFVLDDTANEFDPNSPQFGEKYAPPFLPIAIRDWKGREVARTYTDAYGRYNVLVPSTFTANVPAPSGMSPSMLTACVNAPTRADGSADPQFNRRYSHFCYTFQYMPGTTTYLDTPVLPTGAFTGADQFPVDMEFPNQTPVIAQVTNTAAALANYRGPYIVDCGTSTSPSPCGNAAARNAARTIVIRSAGNVEVSNPYYDGLGGTQPPVVTRDFGFGDGVTVVTSTSTLTNRPNGVVKLGGAPLAVSAITSWTNDEITVVVPTGAWRTGQLSVERCLARSANTQGSNGCSDWRESVLGVTLTVATPTLHAGLPLLGIPARAPVVVSAVTGIQAAIDAADPGALVLVPPGNYEEMVVMSKPVRLQGWGAYSTRINVVQSPAENLQGWRDRVGGLIAAQPAYLLPDQVNILGAAPFADGALAAAFGGEGAGVTVLAQDIASPFPLGLEDYCGRLDSISDVLQFGLSLGDRFCLQNENFPSLDAPAWRPNARIDGVSVQGSSNAAGIMVNGNARHLGIGNTKVFNNLSAFAGGIRIGHPGAELPLADEDANNHGVEVHNNQVIGNAGLLASAGGGIVIGTGSSNYVVQDNWVAGNFTGGQGAGVSHRGLSHNGVIDRNTIVFNESFNQGATVSGGGIFIGGRPGVLGGVSPGSGSVRVNNNLIQGNQAAAGDGGGISLSLVNGADLTDQDPSSYAVDLFNNVVVNNEAGLAGGGIALQDALYVRIIHNTIVHNDSLATAGVAFSSPTTSTPQPAGIVSRGNTSGVPAGFSDPMLVNSIVWENRSFYYGVVSGGVQIPGGPPATYGLLSATATNAPPSVACQEPDGTPWRCWDLGVLGGAAGATLHPRYTVLTSTTGYGGASNSQAAPLFVAQYANGARNQTIVRPETTTIQAPAAFDEGGNFIRPLFGPLTLAEQNGAFWGNYHVTAGVNGLALGGTPTSSSLFPGSSTDPWANVPPTLRNDFDAEVRPLTPDRGADEKRALAAPTTPVPTRR